MEELSQVLMRERELLDTLLFRLETEQLLLASGRTRWLTCTAREVEQVLATIRETEILRAVTADAVAALIGLEHNPSLRALTEVVDEPWRTILGEHHAAFVTVTAEIGARAEANRDLIAAGYRSAHETLMSLHDLPVNSECRAGPTSPGTARVGARRVRVEGTIQAAPEAQDTDPRRSTSLSIVENVDLPRAVVDLQLLQAAYRASLAATARVMQPSLLDFLR